MFEAMLSLAFGWWHLPWGILMTPVQIARNVGGVLRATDASRPSAQLEKLVRLQLATELLAPSQDVSQPTRGQ